MAAELSPFLLQRYITTVSYTHLDVYKRQEEEIAVFKRGRNANTSIPKNAEPADYHAATGFEAMFGYLYLKGEIDRLRQLFSIICEKSC